MSSPDDFDLLAGALADDPELTPPPDAPQQLGVVIGPGGWEPDLNPVQNVILHDNTEIILGYAEKACRPLDTQIYSGDGLVRLGRLRPSEYIPGGFTPISHPVIAFDGKTTVPAVADGYWDELDEEAISAEMENGSVLTGSVRHPVWVSYLEPSGASGFAWMKLGEIEKAKADGWQLWTPFLGHPNWTRSELVTVTFKDRVDVCKVCGKPASARGLCDAHYQNLIYHKGQQHDLLSDRSVTITENVAYMMGAMVGDGSLNFDTGDRRGVSFTNMDQECVSATALGVSEIGGRLASTAHPIQYNLLPGNAVKRFFREVGIVGLSYDKRIPDSIIESPKAVAASFLRGLFDTDGTVEKSGLVSFCTTSIRLGEDVQDLLAAFGILCVRRPKKSASGKPTWTLSMMGENAWMFGQQIGFKIKRKQDRIKHPAITLRRPLGFGHNGYGLPGSVGEKMREQLKSPDRPHMDRAWNDKYARLRSFKSIPCAEKLIEFSEVYNCQGKFSDFLVSKHWLRIESTSRTKCKLGDLHVPEHHSFLAAGVINHNSGKSIGFLHKIVKHCYEEWNALVLIITPSVRTGQEGVGQDLDTLVLPHWKDGTLVDGVQTYPGMGLEYRPGRMDPSTKDRHWWVGNKYGGWSKILLISIPYAEAIEARIKGPAPSMVYIDELTNCSSRDYFTYTHAQINRRRNITGVQHWMASCNPEGPTHWVFKMFWEEFKEGSEACQRLLDDNQKISFRKWPKDKVEPGISRDSRVSVYHVPFRENEHRLPKQYATSLRANLASDPVLYDRLVNGQWVDRPSGDSIFCNNYGDDRHLIGSLKEKTGLAPSPGFPIVMGYDPGSVNPCIAFGQDLPTAGGDTWILFDEVAVIQQKIPLRLVVRAILVKMQYWCDVVGYRFSFTHISDSSAFNQYRNNTGSYDVLDIERISKEIIDAEPHKFKDLVPIRMIECPKPPGSVEQRVRIVRDMLDRPNEFFLSAACAFSRETFMKLESEKIPNGGKFNPSLPFTPKKDRRGHIHMFDALSYPIYYYRLTGKKPTVALPGSVSYNAM